MILADLILVIPYLAWNWERQRRWAIISDFARFADSKNEIHIEIKRLLTMNQAKRKYQGNKASECLEIHIRTQQGTVSRNPYHSMNKIHWRI